jgi:pilus assembly protein CpaF
MDIREVYARTTRHFLAPVQKYLDDPSVTEVLINGPNTVYFERQGRLHLADSVRFQSEAALLAAARNVAEYAGRPLGGDSAASRHSLDARLPDGSRVHIILPPSSRVGVCISIRKFNAANLTLPRLVELQTLTGEAAEFLSLCVAAHRNLIVSGGTGSGKTSLLNALSTEIDPAERIVVIEDSSELQLQQPHTVYLESQPPQPDGHGEVTIRQLFVDSLRMRPDRIVVGEVRRGESLDLIQSMISGHSGSMATVHASTPYDAAIRLETLCLMSGVELPIQVARTQVASALQLIIQINRFPDGRRRVQAISESHGLNLDGKYEMVDIFRMAITKHPAEADSPGKLQWTGVRPRFTQSLLDYGLESKIDLTREIFDQREVSNFCENSVTAEKPTRISDQ